MVIRYGIRGSINYSAVEAGKPTVSLLKYYALGDMGASTSLKTGIYRASVDPKMTESKAWIGDCKSSDAWRMSGALRLPKPAPSHR